MSSSQQSPASSDAARALADSVRRLTRRTKARATPRNILLFLVAFRIVNALSVRTFFQPDEFFQALEPAWQVAFGKESGAWITWEWNHKLRSSIHPLFFAAVYYVVGWLAWIARLSSLNAAEFLVVAPKIAQAVIAATGDYYTWKLAKKVYGPDSYGAWATLALTALSPWQWFCSTRTFSNSAETTLTITALYFWPWEWFLNIENGKGEDREGDDSDDDGADADETLASSSRLLSLRKCLLLAALACVLRPTNVIIWACLAGFAMYHGSRSMGLILLREATLCGSVVLGLSILIDRLFYGVWAFPVFKFLYVNVVQSIAIFYGHNDWHYYLSQGYPLLLTTALPFTIFGLYNSFRSANGTLRTSIKLQLASVCLAMPAVLSIIAHKEVRFIYPLLPALHIIAAEPLVSFFRPAISSSSGVYTPRRLILLFLVLANVFIAYYTTVVHASGPDAVLSYLRQRHEAHQDRPATSLAPHPLYGRGGQSVAPKSHVDKNMTVGFLMPCHSTPWRSHLVFPGIEAWALTCEPPVGLNSTEKSVYLDEADQFYASPSDFLQHHMIGGLWHVPRRPSYMSILPPRRLPPTVYHAPQEKHSPLNEPIFHPWPDYLVFFAQLEPTLQTTLRSSSYGECYRSWNTAWHDDWRRTGDIVVWCLDPDEQQDWRRAQHKKHSQRREQHFERVISRFEKEKKERQKKQKKQQDKTAAGGGLADWFSLFGKSSSLPKAGTSTSLSSSASISTPKSWWSWRSWSWPFSSPSPPSLFSSSSKPSLVESVSSWARTRLFPAKSRSVQDYIPSFLAPRKKSLLDPRTWWPFSSSSSSSWRSSSWWPWSGGKKRSKRGVGSFGSDRDLWE